MIRFDEEAKSREQVGWVVVYRNSPDYKGMDAFLGPDGGHTYAPQTAKLFPNEEQAFEALRGKPDMGTGYLPGEVRPLHKHTVVRYELGGESMHDLNELLKRIQRARPQFAEDMTARERIRIRGGIPMDAVGVQVGEAPQPGKVETFPHRRGPLPSVGDIMKSAIADAQE